MLSGQGWARLFRGAVYRGSPAARDKGLEELRSNGRRLNKVAASLRHRDPHTGKAAHIPDDSGKELATLNDAYEHARKLIHKILFHVGHQDAEAWKVVVLNDDHDAQMIVPFSVAHAFRAQRQRKE